MTWSLCLFLLRQNLHLPVSSQQIPFVTVSDTVLVRQALPLNREVPFFSSSLDFEAFAFIIYNLKLPLQYYCTTEYTHICGRHGNSRAVCVCSCACQYRWVCVWSFFCGVFCAWQGGIQAPSSPITPHPHQHCSSGARVFWEGAGSVSLQRDADAGPVSLEIPAHTLTLTAVRLPQATHILATSPLSFSPVCTPPSSPPLLPLSSTISLSSVVQPDSLSSPPSLPLSRAKLSDTTWDHVLQRALRGRSQWFRGQKQASFPV